MQRNYGQAKSILVWNNATAPHSNGITSPEFEVEPNYIADISEAVLYLYPADKAKDSGLGVVICPGGGYENVAITQEGTEIAAWIAQHGITAAVLKYRMPNHHPEVPKEDAEQAIRILRGEAPGAEGHTCRKVGIMGFSAGGHLAAMVSTLGATKPDFAMLFYPVISSEKGVAHEGSFDFLLPERTAQWEEAYSLERHITPQTPTTLLFLSDDDEKVSTANSTRYYDALKAQGISASLHIYPSGLHGWGSSEEFAYKAQWRAAVLDWLQQF